ncbi:MAG TPA: DNA-directed RNA polymerase subunit omega [Rhodospirillaceae bacterium]|jgi:DNA-directed RNA polymerase subunit omega|nr:DNA-directed RNA polymerase subunit omega [Alphaproteobacteria bacterium]HBH26889.1 DNA-directed RNA polymerase subunit omega [Rhodospirillaceae bacterium]
MARVTVEDCIDKAPTRFALVMAAAQRARQLAAGTAPTLPRENDKNPVIALREIAESTVDVPALEEEMIRSHRRVVPHEEDEEESAVDLSGGQEAWEALATRAAEEEARLVGGENLDDDGKDQDEDEED